MVAYSFKRRFVDPIRAGLGLILVTERIVDGPLPAGYRIEPSVRPKRQTIRAIGKRRHARPGETLQLYTAMRTKQCKKIGEARCKAIYQIEIDVGTPFSVKLGDEQWRAVDDRFAQLDGFENAREMFQFWKHEHGRGVFQGVLIEWEPLT